jgi:serine/threonine protein kinase
MRLDPYEILALLGAGEIGEVYRARDTRLERTVAIKILSQLSSDPGRRRPRWIMRFVSVWPRIRMMNKLKRIDLDGDLVHVLADSTAQWAGAAWNPDGT